MLLAYQSAAALCDGAASNKVNSNLVYVYMEQQQWSIESLNARLIPCLAGHRRSKAQAADIMQLQVTVQQKGMCLITRLVEDTCLPG